MLAKDVGKRLPAYGAVLVIMSIVYIIKEVMG